MSINNTGLCYLIDCRTGCTGCDHENEVVGPYLTAEDALEDAYALHRCSFKASQYASHGVYRIMTAPYEILTRSDDGTPTSMLIGDLRIHHGFGTALDPSMTVCQSDFKHVLCPSSTDLVVE